MRVRYSGGAVRWESSPFPYTGLQPIRQVTTWMPSFFFGYVLVVISGSYIIRRFSSMYIMKLVQSAKIIELQKDIFSLSFPSEVGIKIMLKKPLPSKHLLPLVLFSISPLFFHLYHPLESTCETKYSVCFFVCVVYFTEHGDFKSIHFLVLNRLLNFLNI